MLMRPQPRSAKDFRDARGALRRLAAGLWLATYSLVAAGAPVADAMVGHAAVVAHWEDGGERTCPPQHDPSDCQLCQARSTLGVADGMGTGEAVRTASDCGVASVRAGAATTADQRGIPNTRGPPER